MALPQAYDISLYEGDSFERWMRLSADGQDVDLSTWELAAQIRPKFGSDELLTSLQIELDEGDGENPVDPPGSNGRFKISLTPQQTFELPRQARRAVWDLQFTDPLGRVQTYVRGNVTFDRHATHVPEEPEEPEGE